MSKITLNAKEIEARVVSTDLCPDLSKNHIFVPNFGISISLSKEDTAISTIQEAAEQGDIQAEYAMFTLYEKRVQAIYKRIGFSQVDIEQLKRVEVEEQDIKNCENYKKWLKRAAKHGHTEACYTLANCYENGIIFTKDIGEAFEWYFKAMKQKNESYPSPCIKRLKREYPEEYGAFLEKHPEIIDPSPAKGKYSFLLDLWRF